jgi:hypothetical protein
LEDDIDQDTTSLAFHNTSRKVINDAFKHTRLQSITYYYTQVLKKGMDTKVVQGLHLTEEEYL